MSLNALVGMPVIWQDKRLGAVERAVADAQSGWLEGLVIRRGIGVAKWIGKDAISLIGKSCVLVSGRPVRLAEKQPEATPRVFLTTGECAGEVTDMVIDPRTMRIAALEVCRWPLGQLMGRRGYAVQFHLKAEEIIAPRLLSWMQLKTYLKEEDEE